MIVNSLNVFIILKRNGGKKAFVCNIVLEKRNSVKTDEKTDGKWLKLNQIIQKRDKMIKIISHAYRGLRKFCSMLLLVLLLLLEFLFRMTDTDPPDYRLH